MGANRGSGPCPTHPSRVRGFAFAVAAGAMVCASAAWAGEVVDVGIRDYRFSPAELTIKAGTTVRWTNQEKRTSHSVFFLGPNGFESERLFPDESFQRTFHQPGDYPYTCGPHPEMKGLVRVTD